MKKILLLALTIFSLNSLANSVNNINYDYISVGAGTLKMDGVGTGSFLKVDGSITDGRFIIKGQYGIDLVSNGELKVSQVGLGYHMPMMTNTDLIFGLGFDETTLDLAGGSGGKSNMFVDAELARVISEKTILSGRLMMKLSAASYDLIVSSIHKINDTVSLVFSHQPDKNAKITSISLRFPLL